MVRAILDNCAGFRITLWQVPHFGILSCHAGFVPLDSRSEICANLQQMTYTAEPRGIADRVSYILRNS